MASAREEGDQHEGRVDPFKLRQQPTERRKSTVLHYERSFHGANCENDDVLSRDPNHMHFIRRCRKERQLISMVGSLPAPTAAV